MRKALLATTAAAALVGFTALAAAQNTMTGGEAGKGASPQGTQQEQKASPGGGAMTGQQGNSRGAGEKATGQSNQSAQGPGETTKRGAKESSKKEETGFKQTQEQNKAKPERGAREERGMKEHNAQEERATGKRGASDDSSTSVSEHGGTARASRASSVKLSQDQRTRIDEIIGKGHGHRVSANEHFDVSIGARVPRTVHIETLPEDIVRIVPEYEGFDYVLVGDQILIIDPDSLEIVAVIPV
jgi:uncharacterized protein DUF1236